MYRLKTLAAKYILISLIFFGFIAVFVWSSYLLTSHIEGEAGRINLAGKMRYRVVRMAWWSEKLAEKEDIDVDREARESYPGQLRAEMEKFEQSIATLKSSHPKVWFRDAEHSNITKALDGIAEEWNTAMKPALVAILDHQADVPDREVLRMIRRYDEKLQLLVGQIDGLVSLIEKNSATELAIFSTFRVYALLFLLCASVFIVLYMRRSIVRPLRTLEKGVQKIREGDFGLQLEVRTNDEIGMLSSSFNAMSGTLNSLFEEKSSRLQELDVLNEISKAASTSLSLELKLNRVMDAIMGLEQLRLEKKGAIFSSNNNEKTLRLEVSRNFSDQQKAGCELVPYGECLCGICAEADAMVVSGSNVQDSRHTKEYPGGKEHGHIILPLNAQGKMIGVLCLYLSEGAQLSGRETKLYMSIADIIAVSMQDAQQHKEITVLAQSLETQVAERTAELEAANVELKKLFNAIEQSAESIIITDTEGTILYVNPAFAERTGYSRAEAIGKNPRLLYSGMNSPELYDDLWATIRAGKTWKGTLINKKRSGELFWENATISPVIDNEGIVSNFVAVKADITGRIIYEKELKEKNIELEFARQRAEAANAAKSDFLANMSHELRTPLNAIIGFSEVVRDGMAGPVTEEQKDYLNDVFTSGKHLLSLVNDILDLSKVETGRVELELAELGLKELIEESLLLFREKAMTRKIQLKAEVQETIGAIIADERKIRQVLLNLLGNAVKFTPEGGSVSVSARRVPNVGAGLVPALSHTGQPQELPLQDFIEISVTDTGIGISAEDQKKLFQPFQQLETSYTKKYEGTGLGLSLCKKFVELHGGRIWVESEAGKGSRFVFVIPLRQTAE